MFQGLQAGLTGFRICQPIGHTEAKFECDQEENQEGGILGVDESMFPQNGLCSQESCRTKSGPGFHPTQAEDKCEKVDQVPGGGHI